jgi:hypothetical protein
VHEDVVEAGLLVAADLLEAPLRVRAADDRLDGVVLGDELRGGLVVRRRRQLPPAGAARGGIRPQLR